MSSFKETVATIFLVLGIVVVVVVSIGVRAIFRNFKSRPPPPVSTNLAQNAPHVTIIRPVKGVEPRMYDCIASSFRQDYPQDKFSVRLCVEDENDPAYPILQRVVDDFPSVDGRILLEKEDALLNDTINMGPNPKIRNLSRAYREAKGDIVWIVDCNIWVSKNSMGRMVDKLMGYRMGGGSKPYKFVHQLPIVVDLVDYSSPSAADEQSLLASEPEEGLSIDPIAHGDLGTLQKVRAQGGGRLDEMFMATSHAKFYSAINTVGVAPCAVGKSNMFRKSHLDQATDAALNPKLPQDQNLPTGVDYFSHNICEDHMIGDLIWKTAFPGYKKHGLVWGDLAVQPMSGMSVVAYAARRTRWLRARKYTVLPATLLEPFTESFMFSTYFSFALTTLPYFKETWGIPQTWSAMAITWLLCITTWMLTDWFTVHRLHSGETIDSDEETPNFAKGFSTEGGVPSRGFLEWLAAWLGREALAFPIWVWAVMFGSTVNWRGRHFYVRYDTTVVAVDEDDRSRSVRTPELERGSSRNKRRVD